MHLNFIAFAVPLFLLLMLIEFAVSRRKKIATHRLNESIANLNVGIAERFTDLLTSGGFYFVFDYIYHHYALFQWTQQWYTWVFLFLATDLLWYWYHRAGHRVNLFWAVHVVHHQSEDFNYTVSARITVLQAIARSLFWCVLPLLGFAPGMITALLMLHGAYPFFTHTRLVGKLGWLEHVFVTPSLHRVHHSSNEQYLDKNYGDVLIIWDKLFGTFAEEKETPVYGLTVPLNSHSFLWQHFHFLLEMSIAFRHARGFNNKVKVILGTPDVIDPRIRRWLERRLITQNQSVQFSKQLQFYLCAQTLATAMIVFLAILFSAYLSAFQLTLTAALVFAALISTGAMLEKKTWTFHLEYAKAVFTGILISTLLHQSVVLHVILLVLIATAICYRPLSVQYNRLLYRQYV